MTLPRQDARHLSKRMVLGGVIVMGFLGLAALLVVVTRSGGGGVPPFKGAEATSTESNDVCDTRGHLCNYRCHSDPDVPRPPFPVVRVGYKKTGTSSISAFLTHIGIVPKTAVMPILNYVPADVADLVTVSRDCDNLGDYPWCCEMPAVEKILNERPDARFILSVRDAESWWNSVHNWVTNVHPERRAGYERLLGTPLVKETAIALLKRHDDAVRALFTGENRSRLIEVNLIEEDQAVLSRRLCAFLGVDENDVPSCHKAFPHTNAAPHDSAGDADGGDAQGQHSEHRRALGAQESPRNAHASGGGSMPVGWRRPLRFSLERANSPAARAAALSRPRKAAHHDNR